MPVKIDQDPLSSGEFEDICRQIDQTVLSVASITMNDIFEQRPNLIVVTGLPGAGKTTLIAQAMNYNNYIVFDQDALRRFHPRYEQNVKDDPVNGIHRMDDAARKILDYALTEARCKEINIVVEQEPQGADATREMLDPFLSSNYDVIAVVVAVPEIISSQSVRLKFETDQAALARGDTVTPGGLHPDQRQGLAKKLIETVDMIETEQLARRIAVVNRREKPLAVSDARYRPLRRGGGAAIAVRDEFERDLYSDESDAFYENWEKITELMEARGAPAEEMKMIRTVRSFYEEAKARNERQGFRPFM